MHKISDLLFNEKYGSGVFPACNNFFNHWLRFINWNIGESKYEIVH